MPQNEFIRTILAVDDALWNWKRSRVMLDCFWDRVESFPIDGLSDEQRNDLEKLFFLLDTYQKTSEVNLTELTRSISESMTTIERMRQNGEFNNQHE